MDIMKLMGDIKAAKDTVQGSIQTYVDGAMAIVEEIVAVSNLAAGAPDEIGAWVQHASKTLDVDTTINVSNTLGRMDVGGTKVATEGLNNVTNQVTNKINQTVSDLASKMPMLNASGPVSAAVISALNSLNLDALNQVNGLAKDATSLTQQAGLSRMGGRLESKVKVPRRMIESEKEKLYNKLQKYLTAADSKVNKYMSDYAGFLSAGQQTIQRQQEQAVKNVVDHITNF